MHPPLESEVIKPYQLSASFSSIVYYFTMLGIFHPTFACPRALTKSWWFYMWHAGVNAESDASISEPLGEDLCIRHVYEQWIKVGIALLWMVLRGGRDLMGPLDSVNGYCSSLAVSDCCSRNHLAPSVQNRPLSFYPSITLREEIEKSISEQRVVGTNPLPQQGQNVTRI